MGSSLKLGVTKVGDLLLDSKITLIKSDRKRKRDDTSLADVRLAIPTYQRPYKWTPKNASLLLDDISEAFEGNREAYRIGTLILHERHPDGHSNSCYDIVDGQQRIITLALLLRACFERKQRQKGKQNNRELGEADPAETPQEDYMSERGSSAFPFLGVRISKNRDSLHNVLANYRVLERRINQMLPDSDFNRFFRYIKNNCQLIVIITDNLSEAFQFFDSQNARGKPLYPHDLLKAYHLREMRDLDDAETERIISTWESIDQTKLASLFSDYLYRVKEWVKGNRPRKLDEDSIELFKGLSSRDTHPYAQFYKGAFAFAEEVVNSSNLPFVIGIQGLSPFQLDTPIIAGKPFFGYAKHYFDILSDIQNNDRYEGHFINDNRIVATLNLPENRNGVGNRITRLMFDTAVLLYVDRFCPMNPSRKDLEYLDRFVVYAFIWAYSLRAQYYSLGWREAENYIAGKPKKAGTRNAFNMYKLIADSESPNALLGSLAGKLIPLDIEKLPKQLTDKELVERVVDDEWDSGETNNRPYTHYQSYFVELNFAQHDEDGKLGRIESE